MAASLQSSHFSAQELNPAQRYLYFAYGSNMSVSQIRERIDNSEEKVIVLGRAVLQNYQLIFNKKSSLHSVGGKQVSLLNGKANIAKSVHSSVAGVLFSLTENQVVRMDQYEGARIHPPHYLKKVVSVEMLDGQNKGVSVNAITYIASDRFTSQGYIKPTEDYLETILTGAKENGIDTDPIELAANNYSKASF